MNIYSLNSVFKVVSEAVTQWCSTKTFFLKILQNSQENASVRVPFLIKQQTERLELY